MQTLKLTATFLLLLFSAGCFAQSVSSPQHDAFGREIEKKIAGKRAIIGVGITCTGSNERVFFNRGHHFPMQSVYKFPLALALLDQADKGKISLDQRIRLTKRDLRPDTWSPLRDTHKAGSFITIRELLRYSVSLSDNNACDILFRLMGGPANVEDYVRGKGISEISIVATEKEMQKSWEIQYTNWSTPGAMVKLLRLFSGKELLSESSHDLLWKFMAESPTGAKRIRGLLPQGTVTAHKTGTSSTNDQGLTAAVNDAGIIVLPDGRHLIITVFISDSKETSDANEKIIADIAKAAFDYFSSSSLSHQ